MMKIKARTTLVITLLLLSSFSCRSLTSSSYSSDEDNVLVTSALLNGVKVSYFMYQIQNLEGHGNIDLLADTEYDMLVVEPGFNHIDDPYDVVYLVNKLKNKPNGDKRILLAYIDIGQAEEWRTYWQDDWVAPTATKQGYPDFLLTVDPDGWAGNYPVAYWEPKWQNIWLAEDGLVKQIARYGFDGVYLDWVEAYDDEKVKDYAAKKGINPEQAMMLFIERIRNAGKRVNPDFLIVSQNAPYLIDADPGYYASLIDAIATEDTWFYGQGDAAWHSGHAGDLKGGERHSGGYSTEDRIRQNKKYLDNGIPVFTVDYCISLDNADFVYHESRKHGFIPLVTRVSLSEITETPPY